MRSFATSRGLRLMTWMTKLEKSGVVLFGKDVDLFDLPDLPDFDRFKPFDVKMEP